MWKYKLYSFEKNFKCSFFYSYTSILNVHLQQRRYRQVIHLVLNNNKKNNTLNKLFIIITYQKSI